MSLFFGRRAEQRSEGGWADFGHGGPRGSLRVDEKSAPRMASVFAAQRHIVDYISTLPLDAYRRDGMGQTQIALPKLFQAPDEPGGPGLPTWLGQAALGLANGNAVGWIPGLDGNGYPERVEWLHWSQWDFFEGEWWVKGAPMPRSRIVHIPWIVPPGKTLGLSPIEHFATVIAAGISAQEYADIRRGGGIPPSILKNTARTLDQDQARAVQDRARESFASGKPFATGNDWDFTATAIPPNHAQFVETLKLTANLVAAIYGIDPTEVAGTPGGSLTYSTEELRQIRRAADMRPYYTRLEHAFGRIVPAKQYVRFNADATMRADLKTRTEVVGLQISDGRMSVNEARALEDRPNVPGGDFHNVLAPKAEPASRNDKGEPS